MPRHDHSGSIVSRPHPGKAALGLATELQQNFAAFKGQRILFVHTGGIFGAMDMFA
jgi:1-aminocyclopropane-1-carboxylate deaminase/D-cysteine desulfhydrase-like pyridoxal-dependent ACC family enzyme